MEKLLCLISRTFLLKVGKIFKFILNGPNLGLILPIVTRMALLDAVSLPCRSFMFLTLPLSSACPYFPRATFSF